MIIMLPSACFRYPSESSERCEVQDACNGLQCAGLDSGLSNLERARRRGAVRLLSLRVVDAWREAHPPGVVEHGVPCQRFQPSVLSTRPLRWRNDSPPSFTFFEAVRKGKRLDSQDFMKLSPTIAKSSPRSGEIATMLLMHILSIPGEHTHSPQRERERESRPEAVKRQRWR